MTISSSTLQIIKSLRSSLYGFQASTSGSVSSSLGDRLYINQAPDNVVFPYAVMRLINVESNGTYKGERQTADLEVTVYDRNRANTDRVEKVADFMDGSMIRYRNRDTTGIILSPRRLRDTIRPLSDPADREVVSVRLLYSLYYWPEYLTQYSGSA